MTELAPQLDLETGAWKRAFFEAQLARAVSEAHSAKVPLAVLYVDVDNLQEHNDLHGQPTMNEAIARVAAKISDVVDGQGPIGRVGGGGFAVFLRNFTLERASRMGEKVRLGVPLALDAFGFRESRLTVSVGVAISKRGEPWGNLLEAAEGACRHAKQAGRNAVVER